MLLNILVMTTRIGRCFFAMGLALLLSSCEHYALTLNERTLYTPPVLFTDFSLMDTSLQSCVDQTILDNHIVAPEELTQLSCTYTGIKSLEGLGLFKHIKKLNLAHNSLQNISQLSQLEQLSQLNLANNSLKEIKPLLTLAHLKEVNLQNNVDLLCAQVKILAASTAVTVLAPKHCQVP